MREQGGAALLRRDPGVPRLDAGGVGVALRVREGLGERGVEGLRIGFGHGRPVGGEPARPVERAQCLHHVDEFARRALFDGAGGVVDVGERGEAPVVPPVDAGRERSRAFVVGPGGVRGKVVQGVGRAPVDDRVEGEQVPGGHGDEGARVRHPAPGDLRDDLGQHDGLGRHGVRVAVHGVEDGVPVEPDLLVPHRRPDQGTLRGAPQRVGAGPRHVLLGQQAYGVGPVEREREAQPFGDLARVHRRRRAGGARGHEPQTRPREQLLGTLAAL